MTHSHFWLRSESKTHEERTPLTPTAAKAMLDAGFRVTVEQDPDRIFPIDEYRAVGCEIAEADAWHDAPSDTVVLGLKELADDSFPLVHRHIHFAHVYKDQSGADATLKRFVDGGGSLYDLEFLTLDNGRRIAAFGYWAGYCGAALGVLAFANLAAGDTPLQRLSSFPSKDDLLDAVRSRLGNRRPTLMVIGARGRSGSGAVELGKSLGLDVLEWDMAETSRGGPFNEINDVDVFVNCVFVAGAMPPFVTHESLAAPDRRLSVISDVSCDPYGDYNPLPVYDRITTFAEPTLEIQAGDALLHLIAIDHLPSLLPKESSEDYVRQLLPHLLEFQSDARGVWERALTVFQERTAPLR